MNRYFILIFFYRYACAVPDQDNEEVIIIGGSTGTTTPQNQVSVYKESGWQRDFASLNQGRQGPACGSYVNGGKKVGEKNSLNNIIIMW